MSFICKVLLREAQGKVRVYNVRNLRVFLLRAHTTSSLKAITFLNFKAITFLKILLVFSLVQDSDL